MKVVWSTGLTEEGQTKKWRSTHASTDSYKIRFVFVCLFLLRSGDRPIPSPCLSSKDVVLFPRMIPTIASAMQVKILNDNTVAATIDIVAITSFYISVYQ